MMISMGILREGDEEFDWDEFYASEQEDEE